MCPTCLTSVTLLVASAGGATSTGGLALFAVRKLRAPKPTNVSNAQPEPREPKIVPADPRA